MERPLRRILKSQVWGAEMTIPDCRVFLEACFFLMGRGIFVLLRGWGVLFVAIRDPVPGCLPG